MSPDTLIHQAQGVPGPPLLFVVWVVLQIVAYESWAVHTGKPWTLTEGMRAIAKHWRWFASLTVLLNCFFTAHCFGKALGVVD